MIDTQSYYGKTYYGVFSDECDTRYDDNTNNGMSYWHGGTNQQNCFFVLDLKVHVHINKVILRNSRNWNYNNGQVIFIFESSAVYVNINNVKITLHRGTKDFTIATSNCGYDWKEKAKDTFADPSGKSCEELLDFEYNIGKIARFVRFMALTFYGSSSFLGYFNIDYDTSIIEAKEKYICPGKHISCCTLQNFVIAVLKYKTK